VARIVAAAPNLVAPTPEVVAAAVVAAVVAAEAARKEPHSAQFAPNRSAAEAAEAAEAVAAVP
jgi:hypothetical protein